MCMFLLQHEVIAALPKFIKLSPTLVKGVFDRLLVSYKGVFVYCAFVAYKQSVKGCCYICYHGTSAAFMKPPSTSPFLQQATKATASVQSPPLSS